MAIIQDIPNEILHHVLLYFYPAALLCISMVSHSFRTTSLFLLYKEPYPCLNDDAKSNGASALNIGEEFHRKGSIALFLRTLLFAPGGETLAVYVRTLGVNLDIVSQPTAPRPGIVILAAAASALGFGCTALKLYCFSACSHA